MAWAHQALICIFFLLSPLLPLPSINPSEAQKVSLALYYEALCPYCSRFIVSSLSKIFSDGLISILDLRLVPFGNSLVGSNSSISCQHGPSECFLNTVEACAIIAWPDAQQHFRFIYCVEKLVVMDKSNDWGSCFQWTGLDSHPLVNCYNSGHGQEVELQYAAQTNALQPPHRYVPWVVVNGLPLYDDYENFKTYVCKSYNGELPNACRQQPLESYRPMKADRTSRGCIMNDTASPASAANRYTK